MDFYHSAGTDITNLTCWGYLIPIQIKKIKIPNMMNIYIWTYVIIIIMDVHEQKNNRLIDHNYQAIDYLILVQSTIKNINEWCYALDKK